ncbi:MAG: pyrimidine 5'-nucleotidase [Mariprofundaceae bacterium]|nr:pyrimidine 5'-nucleotidase [Mariprofundaceae bacterium]
MPFDLAIIDLDNTLYRADSGVFQRMDVRINQYIQQSIGLSYAEADAMRLDYWQRYGTTLHGLMRHHGVDAEDFLSHAHHIQAHELLSSDTALAHALNELPGRKVIHTNGTCEHAETILACLNIRDHFAAIYDIRFNHYQPKPCCHTLGLLLQQERANPARTMVIDDMSENLRAAQQLGLQTCLIHPEADSQTEPWDICAPHFHALASINLRPQS